MEFYFVKILGFNFSVFQRNAQSSQQVMISGVWGSATFACVGENDGIASWRTMENRLHYLDALGIPTEFHKYPGFGHGFGIGTGTAAEGWINEAAAFWESKCRGEKTK